MEESIEEEIKGEGIEDPETVREDAFVERLYSFILDHASHYFQRGILGLLTLDLLRLFSGDDTRLLRLFILFKSTETNADDVERVEESIRKGSRYPT